MSGFWTTVKKAIGRPFGRRKPEASAHEGQGAPSLERRRLHLAHQINVLGMEILNLQNEMVAGWAPRSKMQHPTIPESLIRARDLRYKERLLSAEMARSYPESVRGETATTRRTRPREEPSGRLQNAAELAVSEVGSPGAPLKTAFATAVADLLSPDRNARLRAARALKALRLPQCGPLLTAALDYRDEAVRLECLQALVDLRDAGAASALESFVTHRSFRLRLAALRGLHDLNSASLVPACLRGLADPNALVRRTAATLIGRQDTADTAPALAVLLTDEDEEVRRAAAEALGAIGSDRSVYMLIRALEDPDFEVRTAAKAALAKTLSVPIVLDVEQKQFEMAPETLLHKIESLLGWWANARVEKWARSIPLIREHKGERGPTIGHAEGARR